ncbi:hypothetical protein DFR70_12541 [Nocardia tenerifensis]|uniref:Uncharacterized protein n=1 Tax=Nocardia tenerifensis TaxID=228006 RepID=A0A318JRH3_9NOCA|nr:hypothetical protein [Nocardia tenerifensis]PXX54060.1 hypothetical protein DFR70_12541 [Nocardia tenerifensis]
MIGLRPSRRRTLVAPARTATRTAELVAATLVPISATTLIGHRRLASPTRTYPVSTAPTDFVTTATARTAARLRAAGRRLVATVGPNTTIAATVIAPGTAPTTVAHVAGPPALVHIDAAIVWSHIATAGTATRLCAAGRQPVITAGQLRAAGRHLVATVGPNTTIAATVIAPGTAPTTVAHVAGPPAVALIDAAIARVPITTCGTSAPHATDFTGTASIGAAEVDSGHVDGRLAAWTAVVAFGTAGSVAATHLAAGLARWTALASLGTAAFVGSAHLLIVGAESATARPRPVGPSTAIALVSATSIARLGALPLSPLRFAAFSLERG